MLSISGWAGGIWGVEGCGLISVSLMIAPLSLMGVVAAYAVALTLKQATEHPWHRRLSFRRPLLRRPLRPTS